MNTERIEFILLWVSVLQGEGFQGRKECAKCSYCCNWTFLWVSAIFPLAKTVQNFIYFIRCHVFTSWSLRKSGLFGCLLPSSCYWFCEFFGFVFVRSVFHNTVIIYNLIQKLSLFTLLTHVLIMALPWWLDAIHFLFFFVYLTWQYHLNHELTHYREPCVCALE